MIKKDHEFGESASSSMGIDASVSSRALDDYDFVEEVKRVYIRR